MKKLLLTLSLITAPVLAFAEVDYPSSVEPQPRVQQFPWMSLSRWYTMHAEDVAIAETGDVDVLFLGDSITEGWDLSIWQKRVAPHKVANFGIGGDMTQNLLWRMDHGAAEKLNPKVVVIMIGVNNFLRYNAEPKDVFAGVKAVVEKALEVYPNAQVVLNGIFPYEQSGTHPNRDRVKQVNKQIAQLAKHPRVEYHDFGSLLLSDNGDISPDIMPDFLHLSTKGYRIWADALAPAIRSHLSQ